MPVSHTYRLRDEFERLGVHSEMDWSIYVDNLEPEVALHEASV